MTAKEQFRVICDLLNKPHSLEQLNRDWLNNYDLSLQEKNEILNIDRRRLQNDKEQRRAIYVRKISKEYPFLYYFLNNNNLVSDFLDKYFNSQYAELNKEHKPLIFAQNFRDKFAIYIRNIALFEQTRYQLLGNLSQFKVQQKVPVPYRQHQSELSNNICVKEAHLPLNFEIDIMAFLKAYFTNLPLPIKIEPQAYIFYRESQTLFFLKINHIDYEILNSYRQINTLEHGIELISKKLTIPNLANLIKTQLKFFYAIGIIETN